MDARNWEQLLSVFTLDAVWRKSMMQPLRGHAQIRAYFESVEAERRTKNPHGYLHRHIFTTMLIEPIDPRSATGVSYGIVFMDVHYRGERPAPMPRPEVIAEYRDVFVKREAGWRIAEHEAEHIFRSDAFHERLSAEAVTRLDAVR
jgi:hypothetical protein